MTTTNDISLVDAALTAMAGKTNVFATIATMVQQRPEEHFANQIGGVCLELMNERKRLREMDVADNTTLVRDMKLKPESILGFTQSLMNQTCWAARRYKIALEQAAAEEALRGITGIDFSQDVADDMGIDPIDTAELELALTEDYFALAGLYSKISTHMSYLNHIDDFYLFADKRQEDGKQWRIEDFAETFDEALDLMEKVRVRMDEQKDVELAHDLTRTDFTAAA